MFSSSVSMKPLSMPRPQPLAPRRPIEIVDTWSTFTFSTRSICHGRCQCRPGPVTSFFLPNLSYTPRSPWLTMYRPDSSHIPAATATISPRPIRLMNSPPPPPPRPRPPPPPQPPSRLDSLSRRFFSIWSISGGPWSLRRWPQGSLPPLPPGSFQATVSPDHLNDCDLIRKYRRRTSRGYEP